MFSVVERVTSLPPLLSNFQRNFNIIDTKIYFYFYWISDILFPAFDQTRDEAGPSMHKNPTEDFPIFPSVPRGSCHVSIMCTGIYYKNIPNTIWQTEEKFCYYIKKKHLMLCTLIALYFFLMFFTRLFLIACMEPIQMPSWRIWLFSLFIMFALSKYGLNLRHMYHLL